MSVLPKKAKTIFFYDCPHCGMEIEVSSKIVSSVGKTACEYCDSLISFVPIKVSYTKENKTEVRKVKKKVRPAVKKNNNKLKDDCVSMLKNLGFLKREALQMVDQYFKENNPKDLDDAIEGILKRTN